MMKKGAFEYYWILAYTFALVLCPPLKIGSKNIFFVEMLLLPLLVKLFWSFFKGRIHSRDNHKIKMPPKPLILVWVALLTAFICGLLRGEMAQDLTLYWVNYPPEGDHFHFSLDFTRYVRWTLIFSTPWIVQQTLSTKLLPTFLRSFYVMVFISACLALVEMAGYVKLAPIYGYTRAAYWGARSYGTFQSPLEASLIYGGALILLLSNPLRLLKTRSALYFMALFIYVLALAATEGGTAFIAATICVGILFFKKWKRDKKLVFTIFPANFFSVKQANFLTRFLFFKKWLSAVPTHPWIVVTGMGFTGLVSDNSIFLMVLYGGFFLLGSFLWWVKTCFEDVPWEFRVFFIFWFISWLTLDSVGFWGIGRLGWLLLGFTGEPSSSKETRV